MKVVGLCVVIVFAAASRAPTMALFMKNQMYYYIGAYARLPCKKEHMKRRQKGGTLHSIVLIHSALFSGLLFNPIVSTYFTYSHRRWVHLIRFNLTMVRVCADVQTCQSRKRDCIDKKQHSEMPFDNQTWKQCARHSRNCNELHFQL